MSEDKVNGTASKSGLGQKKAYDEKEDVEKNKSMAILSYLWILFLIPLLNKKNSRFCQFHAKQGAVLFFLSFATVIPVLGMVFGLLLLFISVIGIIKINNSEWWKIPVIYDWSKKVNL